MANFITAEQAALLIPSGAHVAALGSGGGVLEPDLIYKALESRFLATGSPCGLTVTAACGFGDKREGGISRFAHEGMTARFIGGHWAWSPQMQRLALENRIEAYNLPQGVLVYNYREMAARRAGTLTRTGLHTFVDPRMGGGKVNSRTKADLVHLVELGGEKWLHYRLPPVDVALIRGSLADEDGNISVCDEAANGELLAMAQAAKNNGGIVICQVKQRVRAGALPARGVAVPGIFVDAVVVNPAQWQSRGGEYGPAFTGRVHAVRPAIPPMPFGIRKIIARRAAMELYDGCIVNLGVGISDGIASVAAEAGILDKITMTVEQGLIGGIPSRGDLFGTSAYPAAILDAPAQFDFYSGGGLDIAFLGMAQADRQGNVNVSRFGSRLAGCGGFIDISQNAKKCVFCGTFTANGLEVAVQDGRLSILKEGRAAKFLQAVEQITFNGAYACRQGRPAVYITERAVFQLTPAGLELTELAPGISLERDVLPYMEFRPLIRRPLGEMPPQIFRQG